MAVLKMCKINICGMKTNRKEILEFLQKKRCVEIHEEVQQDSVFEKMNTATQISIFERNAALAENALEILKEYFPEKTSMFSSLEGRSIISDEEIEDVANNQQDTMSMVNDVIGMKKQIDARESDSGKCRDEIKALQPWLGLDIPMNFRGTRSTGFMPLIISGSYTQEELNQKLEGLTTKSEQPGTKIQGQISEQPGTETSRQSDKSEQGKIKIAEESKGFPEGVTMQVISSDKYATYVSCIFLKSQHKQLEDALHLLDCTKPPMFVHHEPKRSVQNRENRIEANDKEIEDIKSQMEQIARRRQDIKNISDYYRMRSQKYRVLGDILQSKHTFFITGFVSEKKVDELKNFLESNYTVAIDVEEPKPKEDTPVLLENGTVAGGVEGVVTSFGYPNKKEFDPTAITSFFYYFLFGIMLSDAAYGLIMFLGCYIAIKKFPNMEESLKKSLRMFMYCGISTLIWGILFGGYFGNAVDVIGETFFGVDISIPALWFTPIDEPMKMLMYCLAFGIVHLFVGLGLKGYMLLKEKDVTGFVCDVVFWYVFLIGLILLLIPTDIFSSLAGVTVVFPKAVSTLSIVMAIGGMLGILVMGGRHSKSPVKRFLLGAYSLYDTTSWLSDLLSYSRLLALGLATGVIAQVVNTMAAMGGKSVFGVIIFILVFIIGHTFNMAVNLLGAYVHTNRLQYVEFFGKFYEGGGREFKPFKANTKYFKVKEN